MAEKPTTMVWQKHQISVPSCSIEIEDSHDDRRSSLEVAQEEEEEEDDDVFIFVRRTTRVSPEDVGYDANETSRIKVSSQITVR